MEQATGKRVADVNAALSWPRGLPPGLLSFSCSGVEQ